MEAAEGVVTTLYNIMVHCRSGRGPAGKVSEGGGVPLPEVLNSKPLLLLQKIIIMLFFQRLLT